MEPPATTASPPGAPRGERFLTNVFWNWSHVALTLFSGLILAPYIVRKLGPEGYGIWSLVFSLIGYYGLLDFGFRSAVVFYSARFRAEGESERINEMVSTLLVYSAVAAAVLLGVTLFLSGNAYRFFQISPGYRETFSFLVLLVGISVSTGIIFNVFSGILEGFQRFDTSNKIRIASFSIRYFGGAIVLALGYGLVEMGLLAVLAQVVLYLLLVINARRVFPDLRFSAKLVKPSVLKRAAGYGSHTFMASLANQAVSQTPPVLIGHFHPAAYVGYYNLTVRMLQYVAEGLARVGIVAAPQATEFAAQGRLDMVAKLGIYANRYSFTLYVPLILVLLFYGQELILLWIGAEFAQHSAPLLPILAVGAAFGLAGQFTSSALLFGLGKHRGYAYGLLLEALLNVTGMLLVLPRYGIFGGAVVASSLMIVFRGLFTPWLVCRHVKVRLHAYLAAIFARPLLTGAPVAVLLYFCKAWLWSGKTWPELLMISTLTAALYLAISCFTCLETEHRGMLLRWVTLRLKFGGSGV